MPTRKARGAETERLVAAAWQADGWPHAEVTRGQGADLTGTPGIQVECKARSEFRPLEWMRQAARHGDGALPVVIVRPNGSGPENVDNWPAILPHHVLRRLLHLAGYGSPEVRR